MSDKILLHKVPSLRDKMNGTGEKVDERGFFNIPTPLYFHTSDYK